MLPMCAIVNISKTMLRLSYILLYGTLCLNIFATAETKIDRFDPMLVFQNLLTLPLANIAVFLIYKFFFGFGLIFPSLGLMIHSLGTLRPWGWQTAFYYLLSFVMSYVQWFYLFPKIGEKLSAIFRRKSSASKASPNSIIAPLGALARFALSAYMLYWSWWAFTAVL